MTITEDERRRIDAADPFDANGVLKDGQSVRVGRRMIMDHDVDAPVLLADADQARAAMIRDLAVGGAARRSPVSRIDLPADVVAGMTSTDLSAILPAVSAFNGAHDATGRRLALDRLHSAVLRQFGGTAPAGFTADAVRCRARDYLAGALAGAREGFR